MTIFYMCRPDFFQIEYAINPYMEGVIGTVDKAEARHQWDALCKEIEGSGCTVRVHEPTKGLPDQVFMSDPGLTLGNTFYVSQFGTPQRAPEAELFRARMQADGFIVVDLPEGMTWEGNGELLVEMEEDGTVGSCLLGGWGIRSKPEAHKWIANHAGLDILTFELTDSRFYHIDTCLVSLPGKNIAYFPPALTPSDRKALMDRYSKENLYELSESEVEGFSLNAVIAGRKVIANSIHGGFRDWLISKEFTPVECPVSEFLKGGGSTKCMSHRVYRRN